MANFSKRIDENPLLQGLPVDLDRATWWQELRHDPFSDEDLSLLSPPRRELLLDSFHKLYAPTQKLTDIAYLIHRMLINGLIDRDPCDASQKTNLFRLAEYAQRGGLAFPCISESPRGMLLKGVTKQGKTRLLNRVIDQYPQFIPRSTDRNAGWEKLDQLVYLIIQMPTDASKGGFLMQAFIELDNALGTSYSDNLTIRNSSIDQQLVQFLAKLAMHRCGLLVIEEAQESNAVAKSRFGRDFGTFFLRVLNSGIPTVIMGNPGAFEDLEANSQLMSRLSDPGVFELKPAAKATAPEWTKDLVPGIWCKNLLPELDEPIEGLEAQLFDMTGGFAYYLSVLRRESLRSAMRRGARRVEQQDIAVAMATPAMQEGKRIIASYLAGANDGMSDYVDIPGIPTLRADIARGARRRQPPQARV